MKTENTLKSGKCPQCESSEVYAYSEFRTGRMELAVSGMKRFYLSTYLCINCGHFAEYIKDEELKDEGLITKIKETWDKVG